MDYSDKNLFQLKKKYKVIYADPPWYFKSYSQKGEGRNATKHYNCMEWLDLLQLPVYNLRADEGTVLLLWVTDPFLEKAFTLIERWGFKYKTVAFTWAKTNKKSPGFFKGLGYWTRANPEMCLLCTFRNPKRVDRNVDQLIVSKLREHSRKPDEIYSRIEKLVKGPYIELFARNTRKGWDSWGNQVGKFKEPGKIGA